MDQNAMTGSNAATVAPQKAATRRRRDLRAELSYKNIGGIYVWMLIIAVFAIWVPSTFLTVSAAKSILNNNAIPTLLGLSVIAPLGARVFDLSIGLVASLSGVLSTYMVLHGVSLVFAVLVSLAAAGGVGVVNAVIVVGLGVDSFIATLAVGSLLSALMLGITQDIPLTGSPLAGNFARIGQQRFLGVELPVAYFIIIGAVLWFILEHTPVGRRIYATGFNASAARLSGVNTRRIQSASLVASATIAGFAGIVLASTISTGDPAAGSPYLLTAYAIAFLGATQFKRGRFNVWGTVIAALLLGTGQVGLGLASAPSWASAAFTGTALLIALSTTAAEARSLRGRRRRGTSVSEPGSVVVP